MPRRTPEKLRELIDRRPPAVAIFLHGDEEFLRRQTYDEVVAAFLDPGTRDFNYDQVRGGDTTPEALASLLATPPMMADYRVVALSDAQSLSPKARDVVLEAADSLSPGTVFLIDATIPSGSKAKFYDNLKKSAESVSFSALDELEVPGWLTDRASTLYGVEMDIDAARALASAIGAQLGVLSTELQKAVDYVGDRKAITREDIEAVGGYLPQVDRWAWFDKVGEKRFEEAMADLPLLADAGESGVGLVIGLSSHFLKLGLLVAGGENALSRSGRGAPRWIVRRLEGQARRWRSGEIDDVLESLLRADRLLKNISLNDTQIMEELLLRMMSVGKDRPATTAGNRRAAQR